MNVAGVDIQISTAKRYPRSLTKFRKDLLDMATVDEDTAGSMFYALKRAGKVIEGPSVRLAEIAASCWGNLHMAKQTGEAVDRVVFGDGAAWDLETNVRLAIRVGRRITNREGQRYNDDMIATTSLAAMSIALRNAILGVIPGTFIKPVLQKCKDIATGKGLAMDKRRERVMSYFITKLALTQDQVLKIAGKPGIDDLSEDDLATLHGIGVAIKDGETTLEQVLRDADAGPKTVAPSSLAPSILKGAKVAGQDGTGHDTKTADVVATGETVSKVGAEEPKQGPAPEKKAEPAPEKKSASGVDVDF
jgi:hypothetical protein